MDFCFVWLVYDVDGDGKDCVVLYNMLVIWIIVIMICFLCLWNRIEYVYFCFFMDGFINDVVVFYDFFFDCIC